MKLLGHFDKPILETEPTILFHAAGHLSTYNKSVKMVKVLDLKRRRYSGNILYIVNFESIGHFDKPILETESTIEVVA